MRWMINYETSGATIWLTNLVKVPQTWTSPVSLFSFLRQYFDVSTLRAAVQRFFVYGIYWLIFYKEKSQPCCSHVLQKIIKKNYNPIMGFSETTLFSPDLKKLLMNYCDFDDCLEILSWKDFLSVLAAMLTPTCSSWCWWDCALLLSLLLSC